MSILFFLIPIGLAFLGLAIWSFIWAVDNDQFEDLDRPGHSILFDDDLADPEPAPRSGGPETDPSNDDSHEGRE